MSFRSVQVPQKCDLGSVVQQVQGGDWKGLDAMVPMLDDVPRSRSPSSGNIGRVPLRFLASCVVLLAAAAQMTATRSVLQEAVVELLARSCRVHPTGYAEIERAASLTRNERERAGLPPSLDRAEALEHAGEAGDAAKAYEDLAEHNTGSDRNEYLLRAARSRICASVGEGASRLPART